MKKNTRLALSILGGAIVIAVIAIVAVTQFGLFGSANDAGPQQVARVPGVRGQSYGGWLLTCGNAAQTQNRCALVMRARERKSGSVLLSLIVTRGPKGNPILMVNVPPDVAIPAGVIIKPGDGKALRSGFQVCNRQRCEAIFLIDDSLHQALAAAKQTGVRFMLAGNHPFGLRMPTQDFETAFQAWNTKSPAPPPATAATQTQPGANK